LGDVKDGMRGIYKNLFQKKVAPKVDTETTNCSEFYYQHAFKELDQ